MKITHHVLPLTLLFTLLGCTPNKSNPPPPPAYAIDIQPGDGRIQPTNVRIFYRASLLRDGQKADFTAEPAWSLVDTPTFPVGTLTGLPKDVFGVEPDKRYADYQTPNGLPEGTTSVSFKVRILVFLPDGKTLEATRTLTLDRNAPLTTPPEENAPR